jgi:hypothetical protein
MVAARLKSSGGSLTALGPHQPKYQPGGTQEAGTAWAEKSSQPEQK